MDKAYLVIIFVIVLVVLLIVIELVILLVLLVVLVIVVLIIVVILVSKQIVVELLQLELVRPGLGKGGFLRTHSLWHKKRYQLTLISGSLKSSTDKYKKEQTNLKKWWVEGRSNEE